MADGPFPTTPEPASSAAARPDGFVLPRASQSDVPFEPASFGMADGFPAEALEGCSNALRAVLRGQVLLALARNSNPSGPGARQQTIADAFGVKDRLSGLGVELRDFPTAAEMNVALKKAPKVTHRMA